MSRKNINFDDKKNLKKNEFYKNKKVFQVNDVAVNKIVVSKKSYMTQRMQLNNLSDIMIMMLLDHYV